MGGTFFLDEPLHLDDLNRVTLLDVLHSIVVEDRVRPLRLVVTKGDQPALPVYRITLRQLAECYPVLATLLLAINERIVDPGWYRCEWLQ